MRVACLAPLLLAACTFSAPEGEGNGGVSSECDDVDQDGVCDAVDDWPCGATKPEALTNRVRDGELGRGWGADNVVIGDGRRVVVDAGAEYHAVFDWGIFIYCGGPSSCKAQLEVGYGATQTGCLYDDDVSSSQIKDGHIDGMLRAPATPGTYQLRINAGRRSSCGTNAWYGREPGDNSTLAIVCVH
jgi:hypothetical protein